MSRQGDGWENAVLEGLFGSLKPEQGLWRNHQVQLKTRGDSVEYITLFCKQQALAFVFGLSEPGLI